MTSESIVKDISLADKGRAKIEWAKRWMIVLSKIGDRFEKEKPFEGLTIGMALHLEKKTAVLVETLVRGGAKAVVTSCNPLTTDDDVAAAVTDFATVYAWSGETSEEYYANLNRVIDAKPNIIIDDGGDLTYLLHTTRQEEAQHVIGGCEETTTGVIRLRNMERQGVLKFPMMAVNDAKMKHFFDNRYGTGQSSLEAISRATNKLISGARVVVAGYGWVGRGIAKNFKGLGANVIVTEVDPVKALEALYDGFIVTNMMDAIKNYKPDFIITATGNKDVIRREHLEVINDGVILANAGHFNVEVSVKDLEEYSISKRHVKDCIDEYVLPGNRRVYLISEGRLVNLAQPCGQGHPIEVMDFSFSVQALAAEYIVKNKGTLEKKVYNVPPEIDESIARIKLESMGIHVDELTDEQKKYLSDWQAGT
ncbi:MAG: adenosylhomocysteinase [Candidatus Asgardarchaeia archaeon]